MGEAKRRAEFIASRWLRAKDARTGEMVPCRNAGDPLDHLRMLEVWALATSRGIKAEIQVPCEGCRACCYFNKVEFDPRLERQDDLKHLSYVVDDNGEAVLNKRDDGACVHLGQNGCSVHAHRPRPCRGYDCRTFALTGVLDDASFSAGGPGPRWAFVPKHERSALVLQMAQMLSKTHFLAESKRGNLPSAHETLTYVLANLRKIVDAVETLRRCDSETLRDVMGFDPRAVPQERIDAAMDEIERQIAVALKEDGVP